MHDAGPAQRRMSSKGNAGAVRGRDLVQPAQMVTLDGVQYRLKWGNKQARITEQVYEEQYGRDVEYMQIMADLKMQKHRALEACIYGAMIAGGAQMDFDRFEELFTYDSIDQLRDVVRQSVLDTLPNPKMVGN